MDEILYQLEELKLKNKGWVVNLLFKRKIIPLNDGELRKKVLANFRKFSSNGILEHWSEALIFFFIAKSLKTSQFWNIYLALFKIFNPDSLGDDAIESTINHQLIEIISGLLTNDLESRVKLRNSLVISNRNFIKRLKNSS